MARSHLIGDIGGTNARFALVIDGAITGYAALRVADHPDIAAAARAYLAAQPTGGDVRGITLAVAGPVENNQCQLTNSHWQVGPQSFAGVAQGPVRLLNDLEAVAWALPGLSDGDCMKLRPGIAVAGQPRVVIAPGTGLGVAALAFGVAGQPVAIASEGGHVSMAPEDAEEDRILSSLRADFGHVSAERLLSGDGLVAIHRELSRQAGGGDVLKTPAEITGAALADSCRICRAAVDAYGAMLGSFAGNMALAFGARGGVYIGGGIVPRIAGLLLRSAFAERFMAKGRSRAYLAGIPIWLIQRPDIALAGLLAYLRYSPDRSTA